MAKRKHIDFIEEQGVGYIRVQVAALKGNRPNVVTMNFGFADVYTTAELKSAVNNLKKILINFIREKEPTAEEITATAQIYHTECDYFISLGEVSKISLLNDIK